jgi:hypothetical protein
VPQLDKFAFYPVLTWVIVILFFLYNLLLVTGLPKIYKIFLYRKKKLEFYSQRRDFLAGEYYLLLKTHKKIFIEFISNIKFLPDVLVVPVEINLEISKDLATLVSVPKDWLNALVLCGEGLTVEDCEKKIN